MRMRSRRSGLPERTLIFQWPAKLDKAWVWDRGRDFKLPQQGSPVMNKNRSSTNNQIKKQSEGFKNDGNILTHLYVDCYCVNKTQTSNFL